MPALRTRINVAHTLRCYSTPTRPPRHLLSLADLNPSELKALIQNAATYKAAIKSSTQTPSFRSALQGQTVGMIFQKRSTRTRVSTEGAVVAMGGHPMFLGKSRSVYLDSPNLLQVRTTSSWGKVNLYETPALF
jgi:ornithine carbamoyltransferase